ncbi:MAG TPA: aldehyde dehydrogenase PuuC, partial [Xanthomonadales bacterium]|nr:aldehyde dehydrogenase PuuC [Xanthomonadales bacterium]
MNLPATQPATHATWLDRASRLSIRTQAFIDGRHVDAASGKTFDDISPIDGRLLGRVADCEAEDV